MNAPSFRTVVLVVTHAALFTAGYQIATRNHGPTVAPQDSPAPAVASEPAPATPTNAAAARRPDRTRGRMAGFADQVQRITREIEGMEPAQLIRAMNQLHDQPPGVERLLTQQLMMTRLAQIDPLMALSYAGSMSEDQRRTSESTVLGTWTKADPMAAAAYFAQHLDDFGVLESGQRGGAETIAAQWAQSDPAAALQWAQTLPEEIRTDALNPIITRLGAENPDRAIEAINAATTGSQRTEMLQSLVAERGRIAPRETAEWLRGIPGAQDQGSAASSLVGSWMQSDIVGAAEWVSSLGEGPVRDAAVRSLLDSPQLRQSPELAALWAQSIEDDTLREEVLNLIAIRAEILTP